MSEKPQPIDLFRFRRIPQDVAPDTQTFAEDTSRMDEIVDALSQMVLRPGLVKTSAFTLCAYPEIDRPIKEDDFALLTEIISLRIQLTTLAQENAGLRNLPPSIKESHPNPDVRQNPHG